MDKTHKCFFCDTEADRVQLVDVDEDTTRATYVCECGAEFYVEVGVLINPLPEEER